MYYNQHETYMAFNVAQTDCATLKADALIHPVHRTTHILHSVYVCVYMCAFSTPDTHCSYHRIYGTTCTLSVNNILFALMVRC